MSPKKIADVIQTILDELPPGFKNLPTDMQNNLRAALQATFQKLDLVTREEFDVQCALLARTREKLDALEKKIKTQ